MKRAAIFPGVVLGAAIFTGACSEGLGPETTEAAALLSVQPAPGTVGVEVGTTVTVVFDHAMAPGMDAYMALHEGDVSGPEVPGTWMMSGDHMTMTFTPAEPLKAATVYVIHVGGGMMDGDGHVVNLERHGLEMGGHWATGSMMTGGMGSGMTGGGLDGHHMGDGWGHPTNGSYGMVFSFTTAG